MVLFGPVPFSFSERADSIERNVHYQKSLVMLKSIYSRYFGLSLTTFGILCICN